MTNSIIMFNEIRVNRMSPNSGVFIGSNHAAPKDPYGKRKTGSALREKSVRNRYAGRGYDLVRIFAAGPFEFSIRARNPAAFGKRTKATPDLRQRRKRQGRALPFKPVRISGRSAP